VATLIRKTQQVDCDTEELVARARAGDERAFENIYRAYSARVFSLCLRILADCMHAEELTQRIFFRAWMNLNSFRGESKFTTWLYRIAMNEALNALKSFKAEATRKQLTETDLRTWISPSSSYGNLRIDIERAIAGLPQQARAAFVLHDIEGFTHEEIADAMGLAVGTSKAQLFRARKLLREALEK
jgi:RNA polymerase sigma-70 factor, ECF subfamily